MNIFYSQSEKHPVEGSKALIFVFGLARTRGENVVYVTRYTDALATVLRTNGLFYYDASTERSHGELPWRGERSRIIQMTGGTVEFIGIAYNIRKTWSAEAYRKLVEEIGQAIQADPVERTLPAPPNQIENNLPDVGGSVA